MPGQASGTGGTGETGGDRLRSRVRGYPVAADGRGHAGGPGHLRDGGSSAGTWMVVALRTRTGCLELRCSVCLARAGVFWPGCRVHNQTRPGPLPAKTRQAYVSVAQPLYRAEHRLRPGLVDTVMVAVQVHGDVSGSVPHNGATGRSAKLRSRACVAHKAPMPRRACRPGGTRRADGAVTLAGRSLEISASDLESYGAWRISADSAPGPEPAVGAPCVAGQAFPQAGGASHQTDRHRFPP